MGGARSTIGIALIAIGTFGIRANGQQPPTPTPLSLDRAIQLALKDNLSARVASEQINGAAGARERASAFLLPHVSGDSVANMENRNLTVMGVSLPGIPAVVGPFAYYDFRLAGSQEIIDRQAYHNWKASQSSEQAAKLDYQDARDLVIRQTAGLYLAAESAFAEVQASQSRVTTSEALEKLARDQHSQGLATAVDVLRAQVQLARDQQTLLAAQDSYQTALLALARFLGLQPGTPLELTQRLEFRPVKLPNEDQAVRFAIEARPDYRSLLEQRAALVQQQKASHARYYPTFSINGDYGALGRNLDSMPGIGEIQATLSITLFDRDRQGEQRQLASRVAVIDDQLQDLARGIDQDIRKAELDIVTTSQQVTVAEAALALAESELQLSEDRFRNGVTDNIEVITAQTMLDTAQDDRIAALAQHADALAALARALGATEQNYDRYLAGPVKQQTAGTSAAGEHR